MKKFIIAILMVAGSIGFATAQTKHSAVQKKAPMTAVTSTPTSHSPAQTVKDQHKKKTKAEKTEVKSSSSATAHMKKNGTPDKRFKANKHLKKNGAPDKRFKENKGKS